MFFQRMLQNVLRVKLLLLLGLLLLVSNSLAHSDAWTKLEDIPTARTELASCTLDGKIYVIGGSPHKGTWQGTYAIDSVEVYDPDLDSWGTKSGMQTARMELGVCVVNGKIYALGGCSTHGGTPIKTIEEYDPATDSWTYKKPMPSPRNYAAYGVIDNKVYVAGGSEAGYKPPSNKLEIYDPATDTWDTTKKTMPKAVYATSGAVVNNKFYVIGGLIGSPWVAQKTVQMYDPATDTWEYMADLKMGRIKPATSVLDGKIYAIGGASAANGIEVYDPQLNSWTELGPTPIVMGDHCASVVGKKTYTFSGTIMGMSPLTPTPAVYSYEPADPWTQKANIPTARTYAASCELNGKIHVIGGAQDLNSSLNTMEVYDPVTDSWDTTKAPMPTGRTEMCVAAVNGKIYAISGAPHHSGNPVGMVAEYDPVTDTWDTNNLPIPTPRSEAAYGVINNKIFIAGGNISSTFTVSKKLEIYDPATNTWTAGANMLSGRYGAKGAVLNDTLYVIGGTFGSPWTGQPSVQKYDPVSDTWVWGTSLNNGRGGHTANTLNDFIYVIGGDKYPPIMMNVERYDPQAKTWTVIETIPSVLCLHSASVHGDEIYSFGGSPIGLYPISVTDAVYSYFNPDINPVAFVELLENSIPANFQLSQNYPNPFNPTTAIQYQVPQNGMVTLEVYNFIGQRVKRLVYQNQAAGIHQQVWDGRNDMGKIVPTGVYFYQLRSGDFSATRKMLLMQ